MTIEETLWNLNSPCENQTNERRGRHPAAFYLSENVKLSRLKTHFTTVDKLAIICYNNILMVRRFTMPAGCGKIKYSAAFKEDHYGKGTIS